MLGFDSILIVAFLKVSIIYFICNVLIASWFQRNNLKMFQLFSILLIYFLATFCQEAKGKRNIKHLASQLDWFLAFSAKKTKVCHLARPRLKCTKSMVHP